MTPAPPVCSARARPCCEEVRDGDLSGYDHLQHLLTAALVDNFPGQVRPNLGDNDTAARLFTDGLTVARRACAHTNEPH
jgi:hypothetical protein